MLVQVITQSLDWFASQTGCRDVVLTGTCLGARLALSVAARESRVRRAILISCPMGLGRRGGGRRARTRPRIRAGIASLDSIGPRVADRLSRVSDNRPEPQWDAEGLDEFNRAGERADLVFVYGTDEPLYEVFQQLIRSDGVSPQARRNLDVLTLEGAHLHALDNIDHHSWLHDHLRPLLVKDVGARTD